MIERSIGMFNFYLGNIINIKVRNFELIQGLDQSAVQIFKSFIAFVKLKCLLSLFYSFTKFTGRTIRFIFRAQCKNFE